MSTVLSTESTAVSVPRLQRFFGWGLATVLVLAGVGILHHDGVHAAYLIRYAVYLLVALAAPGFIVRRALLGPARTWLADICLALTTGIVLQLIAWAVFVGFGAGGALWIWPCAVLPLLALPRVRKRVFARPAEVLPWRVCAVIGASAASLLWMCHRQALSANPLPGRGGAIYQDLLWHMGLVYEARRSFPLGTPQVIDAGTLKYHWYSDAHMAAASLVSHVPVPVEEMRFFPVLFYFLGFGMTVTVLGQVVRRPAAMAIGAALAAATTTFTLYPWLYLAFSSYIALSPSQLFAVPLSLGLLLAVEEFVRSYRATESLRAPQTLGAAVFVLLMIVGLSGAKASALPSLLGGFGLLWLWSLRHRTARTAVTGLLVVCAVGVGVALKVVAGGDAGSSKQLLAPLGASPLYRGLLHPRGGIGWALPGSILPGAGSHLVLMAGLIGYNVMATSMLWCSLGLGFRRDARRESFTWLVNGTLVASLLAFYVINHPGLSEFYFLRGAVAIGVVGFVYQLENWRLSADVATLHRLRIVTAIGLIGALIVLGVEKSFGGSHSHLLHQLHWSVAILAVLIIAILAAAKWLRVPMLVLAGALTVGATVAETIYQPLTASAARIRVTETNRETQQAALWIQRHVPARALMASNQQCSGRVGLVCPSIQWWVSGIGGHRVLIEGWSYTPKSANGEPFFEPKLLAQNRAVFVSADPTAVATLRRRGVEYLVAVKGATPLSPKLSSIGTPVFRNGHVTVYRLR